MNLFVYSYVNSILYLQGQDFPFSISLNLAIEARRENASFCAISPSPSSLLPIPAFFLCLCVRLYPQLHLSTLFPQVPWYTTSFSTTGKT